jgi:hypothetical protein
MSHVAIEAAWGTLVPGLIFNPETAICQEWQRLKDEGTYIGLPVTGEVDDPDTGGTQMAFSSGAVIAWDASNGVSLK